MNCKLPLVSVVVITYNSSKYVIETLDSIYNQTYEQLELIISDDCSKDDTIVKCKEWLGKYKSRFNHTKIITTDSNTGIPANCNRGFDNAKGVWIKYIAGDDCLYPKAIERFIDEAVENNELIYFSNMDTYLNTFEEKNKVSEKRWLHNVFKLNHSTSQKQFHLLTICNHIFAPAVFMKKELYEVAGKFDEDIRLCEDWPMWLKITRAGYTFHYIDEPLIQYRKYQESTWGKQYIDKKIVVTTDEDIIRERYVYPFINVWMKFYLQLDYWVRINISNSKTSPILTLLYRICHKLKTLTLDYYNNQKKI